MGKNLKAYIKRLKGGDQSAFLPLYEKTAPGLMKFLLWKTNGDRPLSEDILQEGYVRFLLSLDRLQSTEDVSVQAYLLRIVKHCLIDKVARAPQATRQHIPLDNAGPLADASSESAQERAVEVRELAIAMNTLSEKDSEIIWLRDALGMSHREVADQVGISEQASRQAYVRAKRSLLAELGSAILPMGERGGALAPELS